ncbi:MAG: hypothetical protein L0332_01730 [Chloroflexi bacterium]|nr:hypothetical protein [Chloroflexota bacterium]MCI0725436.1 hypothetical protein [Chloroflexota bacterium]
MEDLAFLPVGVGVAHTPWQLDAGKMRQDGGVVGERQVVVYAARQLVAEILQTSGLLFLVVMAV